MYLSEIFSNVGSWKDFGCPKILTKESPLLGSDISLMVLILCLFIKPWFFLVSSVFILTTHSTTNRQVTCEKF